MTRTSKLYLSLGFLSVLLFAADAALAHRPYTTQVTKVALPEGQLGEVRLLHGDGIISANPIRVLVVGANGRLLARSYRTSMMALACSRDHRCRAFDVGQGQVLEIDPATFREGPNVPYYGEELWAIEAGEDSWGFRVRPASLLERIEGELALAVREQVAVTLLFVVGILLGVMVFRKPSQRALLDGMFLLKVLAAVPLLMLSALIDFVSGITASLFLMSVAAGFVVCILFRHLLRWVGNLDQAGH